MNYKKILIILIVCLTLSLSIAFGVYFYYQELNREKLPILGQIKPFALLDQTGNQFSYRNLDGKVWVADFFFTTCGDICPIMSKNMASLSRSFEQIPGLKLVSITVNPETDTPEVLSRYVQKQEKTAKNWYFLTGARKDIRDIALNSFKLGNIDKPIFHSSQFTLVDRHGYIRGYYDGTEKEPLDQLFVDAAKLLKERP